ncbi:MFS transporter [Streptomyces sp. NPDC094034]|uniref:MFS transporter n=1 Tax=Streptomyces sp. NPDC094034 TaxID=3155309 RepID=UPI00332E5926
MTESEVRPVVATAPIGLAPGAQSMPRVATAAFVGSTIEFYDFFLYGTAAALVFGKTFFPALGSAAATAASFATLGVAFVARPVGALIFGHLGDRLGRKRTLVATLLMMGVATILVGLLPTAGKIGVLAPVILVVLRILQGIAAGGEWAGAALFTVENAPADKRGFWGMFPSLGGGAALILGGAAFLATDLSMSQEAFVSWGWRIPFLASAVLVVIGFWIRFRTEEPKVFSDAVKRSGTARLPVAEAFRRQPREILLATGTVVMVPTFTYIGSSYLTSYGTSVLHLGFTSVLWVAILGGATISAGIVVGAVLSDRVGRRRVIICAAAVAVAWSLMLFPILNTGSVGAFALGAGVTMFLSGVAYGPMGAYLPELFQTRYRYTAAGFSYSFAQIIGGAVPPLIAAAVIAAYGSVVFSLILAAFCLLSLCCVSVLRESRATALTDVFP